MANKIYPSLEEFYRNTNIEYGDEDIFYSVADQKLYRTCKRSANRNKNITVTTSNTDTGIYPSAPPLEEISWEELHALELNPDYSMNADDTLPPPYSPHDPLQSDTWVDDLLPLPDYDDDVSTEVTVNDIINNSSESEAIREALDANILCYIRSTGKFRSPSKPDKTNKNNHSRPVPSNVLTSRNTSEQNIPVNTPDFGKPPNKETDYKNWVKWRKQVNRQLAALILLRRCGHVKLQTVDLTRKPLSKNSMKEVFLKATHDNSKEAMTSLNGKPYIMYGIPRVGLQNKH